MAAKDVRYDHSEKGRARRQRHNQSLFRKLMQRERNAQRRALRGYACYRLVFGSGVEHGTAAFGILKAGDARLTPEQREMWIAARQRTRELQDKARTAALDARTEEMLAAMEAMWGPSVREFWDLIHVPSAERDSSYGERVRKALTA